jgi:riboflavin kinase/FMN adenylyltransferase
VRLIEGLDALFALDLAASHGDTLAGRSVVAVGVFDGVHLGHQRLLQQLLELASTLQGVPTVVTFADHPDQMLRGTAPPLLVGVPHRLRLLRRAGVQRLVLLAFDRRLRELAARAFAEQVLVASLRARGLLLGYDSALGRDREGTPARFAALGAEFGFAVHSGEPFEVDGQVVSSTAIRRAIADGDLDGAERFLGRYPGTLGEVVHGDGRGQGLGFPTANLRLGAGALPPEGVYAVEVLLDGEALPGVANLGGKPTFAAGDRGLEVHVLGFAGDLYGRELEVTFRRRLRDVRRFADRSELAAQIARDVAAARSALDG